MDGASLVALAIGVFGVAGVIFTALRFNRDDTTSILHQQHTVMDEIKELAGELRRERDEARGERDDCLGRLRG